jgi:hypothetical protein
MHFRRILSNREKERRGWQDLMGCSAKVARNAVDLRTPELRHEAPSCFRRKAFWPLQPPRHRSLFDAAGRQRHRFADSIGDFWNR